MCTKVICKQASDELEPGVAYEVLDERTWGYRLLVGKVTAWFDKALFSKPMQVAD